MRIIAISMVKNEMDVVESFVRHTLSFADGMLVANHESTDRTGEILEALRKEGLPLQVFPHHSIAQDQGNVMTVLLRRAVSELHADFVLPLDADEFLLRDGPAPEAWDPRPVVETLDPEKLYDIYLCDCETKDMESGHDVFLLQRPYWKSRVKDLGDASDMNRRKVIIGGACAERLALRVTQGNHYGIVEQDGPANRRQVVGEHLNSLYLAHFPCRGRRQYLSKVVVGWIGSVSATTRYTNMARHWQRQFEHFVRSGEEDVLLHLDPANREEVSTVFSEKVPRLRYTASHPGDVADVLREVALLGERLAHSYAEQTALSGHPVVSVILPCWGGRDRLLRSLRSICRQDYPYKELFLMGHSDAAGMQEMLQAVSALPEGFMDVQRVDGPEALKEIAKGKYVHWVSPGDELPKGMLRKMLATMELSVALVCWNNGSRVDGGIEWKELVIQDIAVQGGREALHSLLSQGRLMSGGISGSVFHRQAMDFVQWMVPYLQGERWSEFRLWHDLLPRVPAVSLMCLPPVRREALTAEDILWQQMDWMLTMEEDRRSGRLAEPQYQKRMQALRQNLQRVGQG